MKPESVRLRHRDRPNVLHESELRMKRLRIGINGFGRIGRACFRVNDQSEHFEVVAINDTNPDVDNLAYQLQYDTTYGRFPAPVKQENDALNIGGRLIPVYHEPIVTDVPWEKHDVDIVIESSGIGANLEPMRDAKSSVKHFVITHSPSTFSDFETVIFGVNETEVDLSQHKIISSSICDTIALSPIIKQITRTHQIESGYLVTLHPWLSYQNLLDGPSVSWSQPGDMYSHYALGRASTDNLIPKSTSAIMAAECVFPGLGDRVQSFSYRVPTSIVSSAVLILLLDKDIEHSELVSRFTDFEAQQSHHVIHNSIEPLTSIDYRGQDYSLIIDQRWTKVERGNHVKLVYWYDNEWGYSSRVVDVVRLLGNSYTG